MANSNGIFKRGSSHYLRVVLPKTHQLINAYKSGKIIISLGACSYREALTAGAIKRAQILEADEQAVLTKSKSTSTACSPAAGTSKHQQQQQQEEEAQQRLCSLT